MGVHSEEGEKTHKILKYSSIDRLFRKVGHADPLNLGSLHVSWPGSLLLAKPQPTRVAQRLWSEPAFAPLRGLHRAALKAASQDVAPSAVFSAVGCRAVIVCLVCTRVGGLQQTHILSVAHSFSQSDPCIDQTKCRRMAGATLTAHKYGARRRDSCTAFHLFVGVLPQT